MKFSKKSAGSFTQNHGVPGVVYILENPGLRHGYFKIGCSSRSGAARANDLNIDANTGTPGSYDCIFECRTRDCGLAEQRVFALLKDQRKGKWGQEFFEVDTEHAKATIRRVCGIVDSEVAVRIAREQSAATKPDNLSAPIERFKPEAPPAYHPAAKLQKNRSLKMWIVVVGILAAFIWWSQKEDKPRPRPTPARSKPKLSVAPGKSPTVAPSRPQRELTVDVPQLPDAVSESPEKSSTMQPTVEQIPTAQNPESNLHADRPDHFDDVELSEIDRNILEKSCSPANSSGPAVYKACIERELASLKVAPPYPKFDGVLPADVARIYKACQPTEYSGPGAYRTCLKKKVDALAATATRDNPGRR